MTVHLSVFSGYSLLRSTIRIEELCRRAKEYGYTALALTDHHVMYGIPAFERECRKQGIHPLFGMEVSVSWQEREVQFILLARDNTGYKQLMKLSSLLSGREAVDRAALSGNGENSNEAGRRRTAQIQSGYNRPKPDLTVCLYRNQI